MRVNHDCDYPDFIDAVRKTFASACHRPLFRVSTHGLWQVYLDTLPSDHQVHNCRTCRHFIERFGGLVVVNSSSGRLESALWDEDSVPEFYRETIRTLAYLVEKRSIESIFLSPDRVWGTPTTGNWTHLAVWPPARLVNPKANQIIAQKQEDLFNVRRFLDQTPRHQLEQALRIVESEVLSRSDRFVAPIRWLLDFPQHRNLQWLAVAGAPEGFCHPRSSMISTLFEDLPFDAIKRRWEAQIHPLRYQRPQAAPTAGNVARAETLFQEMGLERSLERRFARLSEVIPNAIWTPSPGGLFSHLLEVQGSTMTWVKFASKILPKTRQLKFYVPESGNFEAILTAEHADAPPILRHHPFSTYVYHHGSRAGDWGLWPGTWVNVEAVVPRPTSSGVTLVLKGCMDTQRGQGNGLFPEILRSELREVRATIEAYSKRAEIGRVTGPGACGYGMWAKNAIRIQADSIEYKIDRWD